jgi:hypothetical protein
MSEATTATATSSETLMGGDTSATAATSGADTSTTTTAAAETATTTTTEATAKAGDKAADTKPDAGTKEGDKPAGAPEKYEFTVPEGVKLNEAVMGEFEQIAKDLNLPQEAAQKLVDLGARMQSGNAEQVQAAIEAQGEKWAEEAKVDKEFGGDKFDENLSVAKKALDQFGTPELKSLLVASKLGNHPEVLRTFVRIGKAISEDGFVPGRTASSKPAAQSFYSASNMNP